MTTAGPDTSERLWTTWARLWRGWIRQHYGTLVLIWLSVGLIAAASALYPYIIKISFDAFDRRDAEILRYTPIWIIIATALRGGGLFAQTVLTSKVVAQVEADLQKSLFNHLIDADVGQLQRETPAAMAQRFTTDFAYVRDALTKISTALIRDLVTAMAILIVMFWIDWVITVVALLVLPVVVPPIEKIARNLKNNARETQHQTGVMASSIVESLAGVRIAKTFGLDGYLKNKTAQAIQAVCRLKIKAAVQRGRLEPLYEAAGGVAVAAILVFIGWRITNGQSTIGDFTGYVTAALLAAQSFRSLGNLNAFLREAQSALQRIFALLDEKPHIVDIPNAGTLAVPHGEIRFENINFSYATATANAALSNVTLTVPAGKTTAIVGRSGAGKSSLLSLVPRLFNPTSGQVLIDGVDIASVTLASLRQNLAVVAQDVTLFDDTVRSNIGFGKAGASDDEIIAAAKAAAAHDFIMALPDGYDTEVGDRGGRLSGGERQRVALARAFLRNAPILLLDEPTSALDAQSEDVVQRALTNLMSGRTTLVVAHRLSTIRAADLIVVMEHGKIVEQGHHEYLISQNGAYAAFIRLQLGDSAA